MLVQISCKGKYLVIYNPIREPPTMSFLFKTISVDNEAVCEDDEQIFLEAKKIIRMGSRILVYTDGTHGDMKCVRQR